MEVKAIRVSIVIPTYNQAEYLAKTIDSVLGQDYANLEILVVNDGSTDNTAQVLQAYADRVKVITQPNAGQAFALNNGWKQARGEIIGYLSSDDRLHPHCVSTLVQALMCDPDTAVVYPDFELINEVGDVIRSVVSEEFDLKRMNTDLVCQPGVGTLFRRQAYLTTGGWRTDLRQVPDYEFWLRLSRFGPLKRVPQTLGQYRVQGVSGFPCVVGHNG